MYASRAVIVALVAFVFDGAMASKQIQTEASTRFEKTLQASVTPILSADVTHTGDSSLTFRATFSACVTPPPAGAFRISPSANVQFAIISPENVVPVGNGQQQFDVTITFLNKVDEVTVFEIYLIEGSVSEVGSGGSILNSASNVLFVSWYQTIEGVLTSDDPASISPTQRINWHVDFSQDVYALTMAPIEFIDPLPFPRNQLESLELGPRRWNFTTYGYDGDNFLIRVAANSLTNKASMSFRGSNQAFRTVQVDQGPCEFDLWNEWTACSEDCSRYSGTFQRIVGDRTRTRVQTSGAPGCAPTTETEPCNTALCSQGPYLFGARPFSGERGNECASDCNAGLQLSGCSCDSQCLLDDDCCQSFFLPGFNQRPPCSDRFQMLLEGPQGFTPARCQASQCQSLQPVISPISESYFCYCDEGCSSDSGIDLCCGGSQSRSDACASTERVPCCSPDGGFCAADLVTAAQCTNIGGVVVSGCIGTSQCVT